MIMAVFDSDILVARNIGYIDAIKWAINQIARIVQKKITAAISMISDNLCLGGNETKNRC